MISFPQSHRKREKKDERKERLMVWIRKSPFVTQLNSGNRALN